MKLYAMALLAMLCCAATVFAQEALDADQSAHVRAMVAAGVAPPTAERLVVAMAKGGLTREQMERVRSLVAEMGQQRLAVDSILSKVQEGVAKRVAAGRIVSALEKVASRQLLATVTSRDLPGNRRQREEIRRMIADGLAAGIKSADMQQIMQHIQERTQQMGESESANLALETSRVARDMSRVGTPSESTRGVIDQALEQQFDAGDMRTLREAFMQETPRRAPAEVAAGLTHAIRQGTPPDQLQAAPPAPAPPPPNPAPNSSTPAGERSGGGKPGPGSGSGQGSGGGHGSGGGEGPGGGHGR